MLAQIAKNSALSPSTLLNTQSKTFLTIGRFILCCSLFAAPVGQVSAQRLQHKLFDQKDGLPQEKIQAIQQDNDGFIWLTCGTTLIRFDGHTFHSMPLERGDFEAIQKDATGRLWLSGLSPYIAYVDQHQVHPYAYNHLLESYPNSTIKSCYVDAEQKMWIGLRSECGSGIPSFVTIDSEGKLSTIDASATTTTWWVKQVDDTLLHAVHYSPASVGDSIDIQIIGEVEGLTSTTVPYFIEKQLCYLGKKLFVITRYQGIYEINRPPKHHTERTGLRFNDLYTDVQGRLWIPSEAGGVFCFQSSDLDKTPRRFLRKKQVTAIFQSDEGGHWLGTIDGKLYYLPTLEAQVYDSEMGLHHGRIVTSWQADDAHWLVYKDGFMSRVDRENQAITTFNFKTLLQTAHVFPAERKVLLGSPYTPQVPSNFPYKVVHIGTMRRVVANAEGGYSITTGKAIYEWSLEKEAVLRIFRLGEKAEAICVTGPHSYLYSDQNGLHAFENHKVVEIVEGYPTLKNRITNIVAMGNNWYALNCHAYGIYLLKYQQGIQMCYPVLKNDQHQVQRIQLDTHGFLWSTTSQSVEQLQAYIQNDSLLLRRVATVGYDEGLPRQQIIKLAVDSQYLWLTTSEGLTQMHRKKQRKTKPPHAVYPLIFLHNGRSYKAQSGMEVDYSSDGSTLYFSSPEYSYGQGLSYQYQLEGVDAQWKSTNQNQVSYQALKPGTYHLQLRALAASGIMSPVSGFTFSVAPSYWQTLWFKSTVIGLSLLSLALFIYLRLQRINTRKRLLTEIKSYRNKTLRLQMNPHFMYNTLGSIQSFVLKEESRLSSRYIAKFSRLMRLIFEHNTKELITLEKELEALGLYVELETLRRKDQLDFEIEIQPSLQTSQTLVPPMLLQPFVENSIQHGLSGSKAKSLVSVRIRLENGGLLVTITDNGAWSQNPPKQRVSGGGITSDRITLFNQERNYNGAINIQQLDGLGTQVTFSIAHITIN